jgi:hypothetical protein
MDEYDRLAALIDDLIEGDEVQYADLLWAHAFVLTLKADAVAARRAALLHALDNIIRGGTGNDQG